MNKFQKPQALDEDTDITKFENWKHNMLYILTLDESTAQFIKATWLKTSKKDRYRGFKDDTAENVPDEAKRKSAATKVSQLELMLGQIANFAPIVSRKYCRENYIFRGRLTDY